MRVTIFKSKPKVNEWAPSGPEFSFRPFTADDGVYAEIEVPPGWFLVGEPEPMLVCRTHGNTVVALSAGEAWTASLAGKIGFSAPGAKGAPIIEVDHEFLAEIPETPALPAPEAARNGRANLPAKRRK